MSQKWLEGRMEVPLSQIKQRRERIGRGMGVANKESFLGVGMLYFLI